MWARRIQGALTVVAVCLVAGTALAAPPASDAAGTAGKPSVTAQEPPADDLLISREHYFYSSFARRDPFASLLEGRFASTGEGELLDVGEMTLVGVVWGENDKFAVVQDKRNNVHTMRVGDRVVNGKVIKITRTSMTIQHYFFGETANVTIHISEGDGDNETR
jgi:hypothetical protein